MLMRQHSSTQDHSLTPFPAIQCRALAITIRAPAPSCGEPALPHRALAHRLRNMMCHKRDCANLTRLWTNKSDFIKWRITYNITSSGTQDLQQQPVCLLLSQAPLFKRRMAPSLQAMSQQAWGIQLKQHHGGWILWQCYSFFTHPLFLTAYIQVNMSLFDCHC